MLKKNVSSLSFYFFENLSKYKEISHFVSTKPLNISFSAGGDDLRQTEINRRLIAKALKISLNSFVFMWQIHGHKIQIVTEKERGRGVKNSNDEIIGVDAMITKSPKVMICAKAADCVPILMFDPVKRIVAAVHAGRKGTELQILKLTIDKLKNEFRSNPKDLIVGVGPSIGPCHYEVDLWRENKTQLLESGVLEKNIEMSNICTYCQSDDFFSARKDGGVSGNPALPSSAPRS